MTEEKMSLRRMIITDVCLVLIIICVYLAAFTPIGSAIFAGGPALKGNTGQSNVALQIAVDEKSDIPAYLDTLDEYDVKGTFFFRDSLLDDNAEEIGYVQERGHGVGYFSDDQHSEMYIGGGYSVPVMSYAEGSTARMVSPSIDLTKLKEKEDWQQTFSASISQDMFIYVPADNDFGDFEKIVQIILNKGYTILKIEEML